MSAFPTAVADFQADFRDPRSIIDVWLQVEKSYGKKVVGVLYNPSAFTRIQFILRCRSEYDCGLS